MIHSLVQQVVRQSPAYYACVVAHREDHSTRLITYPYYTKYQQVGDHTSFRHIDLNVPRLVADRRGHSLIQGSLSLTDESADDCTELLLGMHRHLGNWWADVKRRYERRWQTPAPDGFIHRVDHRAWTFEDRAKYGSDFVPQPCRRGEIRISLPHLPHGALGSAKSRRKTILPWFMGIGDDHKTLDTFKAGTWSDLARAHRDLRPAPTSPSGHPNSFPIPYAFPAAPMLTGLGVVSDALVGRLR